MSPDIAIVPVSGVWNKVVTGVHLFVLLSVCYSVKASTLECQFLNGFCFCTFPDGYGFNLSKINQWHSTKDGNTTFWFRPCSDPEDDTSLCHTGTSVCMLNETSKLYTNLGLYNETRPFSPPLQKPIQLQYSHFNSSTTVHLSCSAAGSYDNFYVLHKEDGHYELALASPQLCLEKILTENDPTDDTTLSTGSVLVIMFFVFTALYFVGGALALKLLRGAEGREMIPNYDFWVSLPGLVKEGVMFTLSGCQTSQAYDRI